MYSSVLSTRRVAQGGAAIALAGGLILAGGASASAHVTVTPTTTDAGSYTVLNFSVPHGCDGSATTKVAIKIPEDIVSVTPTVNSGWNVEKTMLKLDEPVDNGHGGQYTERVDQVIYTAKTPLPDDLRDTFELSLQLPDKPGETLVFPSVQTCEEGETAWIQTAAKGEDEPEHPAPAFELTAAGSDGHDSGSDVDDAKAASDESTDQAGGSSTVGWIGVVLGALGLGVGGVALARSGRRSA